LTFVPSDSKEGMSWVHPRIRGWWLAAGAAVLAVVALSLGPDVTPGGDILDSVSHAAAYAALTAVVLLATHRRAPRRWASVVAIALGLLAFGAAMEFAQAGVHRDATVADWLADAIGITVAAAVHSLVRVRRWRRSQGVSEVSPGVRPSSIR
jgi:VanZ family protein